MRGGGADIAEIESRNKDVRFPAKPECRFLPVHHAILPIFQDLFFSAQVIFRLLRQK